ncbi:MAG: hypothetical protein WCK28_13635 [Burkholderiales bacterium]|jgi:hypothetical protein
MSPAPTILDAAERDALYRDCAQAITAVGRERESLFLARLALLLMEACGDAARCREAMAEAARDVPAPSLSRG